MIDPVVAGLATVLTMLLNYEIYHFTYVHRRRTGTKQALLLTWKNWNLWPLLVHRYSDPELTRLQIRMAVVAALWVTSVVVLFVRFLGSG